VLQNRKQEKRYVLAVCFLEWHQTLFGPLSDSNATRTSCKLTKQVQAKRPRVLQCSLAKNKTKLQCQKHAQNYKEDIKRLFFSEEFK